MLHILIPLAVIMTALTLLLARAIYKRNPRVKHRNFSTAIVMAILGEPLDEHRSADDKQI